MGEIYSIEEYLKYIGTKVREIRKEKYSNYLNFCDKYSFNRVTLNNIENGQDFKMSSLIRILKHLDVPLDEFFDGIDFSMMMKAIED